MSDTKLILPVTRKVPTSDKAAAVQYGTADVQAELVNWAGIHLMLHLDINHPRILSSEPWRCTDERTGFSLAKGPSPETALAAGIAKIRGNWQLFQDKRAALPTINRID